uniref:Myosin heavy chain, non-muscle n=1 Tax=Lygus hesperus TaxID=30085 RepID=A0A146MCK5_LYGHE
MSGEMPQKRKAVRELEDSEELISRERRKLIREFNEAEEAISIEKREALRILEETEAEINIKKRKALRELEDLRENYDSLLRENDNLKNKLRRGGGISGISSRLGGSKRGSIPGEDSQGLNNTTDESVDGDDISNP